MFDYKTEVKTMQQAGHSGFCAPMAIAAVSGFPALEVAEYMECEGLRRHKRAGCTIKAILDTLQGLGLKWQEIPRGEWKTPVSIEDNPKRGAYMVFTKGHVFAVVNGRVLDWTAGRRHRVLNVIKISI